MDIKRYRPEAEFQVAQQVNPQFFKFVGKKPCEFFGRRVSKSVSAS
jgi:hypothetical protein